MNAYLLNLWDKARNSYWLVPGLIALGSLCLSYLMPLVDSAVGEANIELPEWVRTTTDTARATLSAMGGAMITVTGTVFSITIVTLSLTSQQFGPRLLRRFMHDLPTQITLGVFLSTSLYCLLLLRVVESREDGLVAPHISISVAVAFTVLSMMMLIVYIHHVAVLIQAPNVVASVARDLDSAIDRMFPERLGEEEDPPNHGDESPPESEGIVLFSHQEGYMQALAAEDLMSWARAEDLIVRLQERPGSFVVRDAPVAEVWRRGLSDQSRDDLEQHFNSLFIVGERRTPRQDVECAVDELAEVAVRALSPGVNDPFTAATCVDRLGASLARFAERRVPDAYRYDDDGVLRVITRPIDLGNMLEAAFNQIRQYSRDSVAVTIRLLESLEIVASRASTPDDTAAVRAHAEMIVRGSESLPEEFDKRGIRERYERVLKAMQTHQNAT
ncbi:hypothetical protein Pla123a_36620 [Posidoniimonas polymericola]|uniref:DUF2254 domain-containing protein n=1 Tax=Posidoniimonas polymericola TaxID=2528002 RepID=A0A5C5YFH9_9BACT|nr:DUF2254 domain-containing protein [Posidoniimonas polymericola]TWT73768.1 hypothetical protein Pla123a_36620 [Posidoniimonas polymericola]